MAENQSIILKRKFLSWFKCHNVFFVRSYREERARRRLSHRASSVRIIILLLQGRSVVLTVYEPNK